MGTNGIGRRQFLQLSGMGTVAVLGSGFFRVTAADAAESAESAAAGLWEFDSARGLFVQPITTTGTAVAWEFNTDGNAEGWTAAQGLAPFVVRGGTLSTSVTGFDPYMTAPPLNLNGIRDRILRFRMRATSGESIAVYFATDKSPTLGVDKLIEIPIKADGAFHEYTVDLAAKNALWQQGTVKVFRLDREPPAADGAEIEFDYIRIDRLGARIAIAPLIVRPGSVRPGEELTLAVQVSNVGGEPSVAFPAKLTLPNGVSLVTGNATQTAPVIQPDGKAQLLWTARPATDVPGVATFDLEAPGSRQQFGAILPVVPVAPPSAHWWPSGVHVFQDQQGHVHLQNKNVRAIVVRGSGGYAQLLLDVRHGQEWRRMATAQPLSYLIGPAADGVKLLPIVPDTAQLAADHVVLTGQVTDADGVRWTARVRLAARPVADDAGTAARAIQATYSITPDRQARLLAFGGPSLTAGEGSFGKPKHMGLFPGLEWLVAGERSSSTLDVWPPDSLRTTPHPLRVTVPVMAISAGGSTVSLAWDTNQQWDGQNRYPSARFASPNWLAGQANHLLSLFVPAVPDQVAENAPWATTPYSAAAGRPLSVTADFVVNPTADVLTAVEDWYSLHGVPEPATMPFTWTDELALVRHAYLDSYWDPAVKGWAAWSGQQAMQYVPYAVNLHLAGLLTGDSAALTRVHEFVVSVLTNNGPSALGNMDGTYSGWFHAPFYLGHLEGAIAEFEKNRDARINSQLPSGGWAFNPKDKEDEILGVPGTEIMGVSTVHAHGLLRYARLTGDPVAHQAGMRALAFIEQFDVPRAVGVWEMPIHTPTLLGSSYGIAAYTEAYRLTGDTRHLDRAIYWARTGLPFLYAWSAPDRPYMPYASISDYGATMFTIPWFGRPVQWVGLVYAYFLLSLLDAVADPSCTKPFHLPADIGGFPWRRIAEAIVISALHQQRTTEPYKGGYPDSWLLVPNTPVKDFDLNPDDILKPVVMLLGHPVDVQTALIHPNTRISTAADVLSAERTSSRLTARLGFFAGHASQLLVTGLPSPRAVQVDGRTLPPVTDLDAAPEGWKHGANGTTFVKLRHAQQSTLTIDF
ncbi:hypothetical protein ACIBG7_34140 [Nonomuraea sp. NPDC050328]|uniref:hypothetical protein n=1 Tax=Nonomuraea sp. NPDC050328 TaxID=3364361 RepID=UPI0037878AF6